MDRNDPASIQKIIEGQVFDTFLLEGGFAAAAKVADFRPQRLQGSRRQAAGGAGPDDPAAPSREFIVKLFPF
jgi:hypothetical protein